MAALRTYELTTTNKRRTKAELRETSSTQPSFELDFSFVLSSKQDVVLRGFGSPDILGTARFSWMSLSTPIHLCSGDGSTDPQTAMWEDIHCRDKLTMNDYEIAVDFNNKGGAGRKTFLWKRTHANEKKNALTRSLDWLDLKFVDAATGEVVARFLHHCKPGSKRGVFEIAEHEGGDEWLRLVVLSGSAVLEYMRKVTGMSF